jgi:hypothetical protein
MDFLRAVMQALTLPTTGCERLCCPVIRIRRIEKCQILQIISIEETHASDCFELGTKKLILSVVFFRLPHNFRKSFGNFLTTN